MQAVDRQLLAGKLNVVEVLCPAGHQNKSLDSIFLHQIIFKKATVQAVFKG